MDPPPPFYSLHSKYIQHRYPETPVIGPDAPLRYELGPGRSPSPQELSQKELTPSSSSGVQRKPVGSASGKSKVSNEAKPPKAPSLAHVKPATWSGERFLEELIGPAAMPPQPVEPEIKDSDIVRYEGERYLIGSPLPYSFLGFPTDNPDLVITPRDGALGYGFYSPSGHNANVTRYRPVIVTEQGFNRWNQARLRGVDMDLAGWAAGFEQYMQLIRPSGSEASADPRKPLENPDWLRFWNCFNSLDLDYLYTGEQAELLKSRLEPMYQYVCDCDHPGLKEDAAEIGRAVRNLRACGFVGDEIRKRDPRFLERREQVLEHGRRVFDRETSLMPKPPAASSAGRRS